MYGSVAFLYLSLHELFDQLHLPPPQKSGSCSHKSATMMISVSRFSLSLLLLARMSLACRCAGPTDVITTDFMQQTNAVGRVYVNYGISPFSTAPDAYLYYLVTAQKWFKGGIGEGKLVLRTSAHSSSCGASVKVKDSSILFGTISYEAVPGYAGTVPTLTIDSCKPQKPTKTVSMAEWKTLFNYKEHIVCEVTDCDGLTKPPLDPITCPAGTEYKQLDVCEGQDNGSCGWSLSGSCEASSAPVVCEPSDCGAMKKPSFDDIKCPAGTELSVSYKCEAQDSNTCGWSGSGSCILLCEEADCAGLAKPQIDPLPCATGFQFVKASVCSMQNVGSCGWNVGGQCQPI